MKRVAGGIWKCRRHLEERLLTVIDKASSVGVDIVLMQEVPLAAQEVSWVSKVCENTGWRVSFSDPLPRGANGAVVQGGCAIMWRSSVLGKTSVFRQGDRLVGIKCEVGTFASAYGPAARPSPDWFDGAVEACQNHAQGGSSEAWACIGDLNWRYAYEAIIPESPQLMAMSYPTTTKSTYPSRAVSSGMSLRQLATIFLEGIPHHGLFIVEADQLVQQGQALRLRRTATYEVDLKKKIEAEALASIRAAVDSKYPLLEVSVPLAQKWRRWHERTEEAFKEATARGVGETTRKAERPKGSEPTMRKVARRGKASAAESILTSRLEKLGRRILKQIRKNGPFPLISGEALKSFAQLLWNGVLKDPEGGVAVLSACHDAVAGALSAERREEARTNCRSWHALFSQFGSHTWKAASAAIREPSASPTFTADSIFADWISIWVPNPDHY